MPDFVSSSTLELDCASFFAAPIYLISGNLSLSLALVHICTGGLVVFLIFGIFHNLKISREYAIITALLLFTLYKQGELNYVNMLFFSVGQYEFRLICLLCLFYLTTYCGNRRGRTYITVAIITAFVFFLTGLSAGVYVMGVILIPFLLFEFLVVLEHQKFLYKHSNWPVLLISFISAVTGAFLLYSSDARILRNSFHMLTEKEFIPNFQSMIMGIWRLLGGIAGENISLFSV